jgi:hypothetical protein
VAVVAGFGDAGGLAADVAGAFVPRGDVTIWHAAAVGLSARGAYPIGIWRSFAEDGVVVRGVSLRVDGSWFAAFAGAHLLASL